MIEQEIISLKRVGDGVKRHYAVKTGYLNNLGVLRAFNFDDFSFSAYAVKCLQPGTIRCPANSGF